MEDWKALYASKLTTADEAVRQIPNGSRVFFGHAANEPPVLVDALVRNYEQYKDVEIVHWVPMGKGEYCDPKMKGHLHHNAMFVGGPTRKAVQEGRADYTPFFFHQSTRFFSDGTFPIDVAMVSVTPPDKHGYVSLGVSVGGTKPACLNAKMVIAQVNDQMPRTMGESFLHVSQLTCCVEASTPLPELGGGTIGEVEEAAQICPKAKDRLWCDLSHQKRKRTGPPPDLGGDEAAVRARRGGPAQGVPPQSAAHVCHRVLPGLSGHRQTVRPVGPQQHRNDAHLSADFWRRAPANA